MKTKNTRRGFTLIELLVVVLIIGILAAVAVPQYQKAVAKARMMEVITNLSAIAQAHQMCFLGKGEDCTFDEIDIELGGNIGDKFAYRIYTEDTEGNEIWAYAFSDKEDVCFCYLKDGEIVVSQNTGLCAEQETKFDYAILLNLRDVSGENCSCC